MNNARAITADFATIKVIQSRGTVQIICEKPLVEMQEVLAKLGTPLPNKGIPVAIAVLEIQPDVKKDLAANAEKVKRNFEDLPYSQQAALLCKDTRFQKQTSTFTEDGAIVWLKGTLHIKSRSELDDPYNANARSNFINIRDSYRAKVESYPEQRG